VLLLWLYVTGLIFIIGGEVNAVLEHAEAEAAQEAGEPSPLQAPHLKSGVTGINRSGRERLAFWRWRRRMAESASSEVEPPAELEGEDSTPPPVP
jgi:membrane protein